MDSQAEIGEAILLDRMFHGPIEGREVDLRSRRIGLGLKLHTDRIQGRRVVRADPMVAKALQIEIQDLSLVFVGLQPVVTEDVSCRETEGSLQVVPLGAGRSSTRAV